MAEFQTGYKGIKRNPHQDVGKDHDAMPEVQSTAEKNKAARIDPSPAAEWNVINLKGEVLGTVSGASYDAAMKVATSGCLFKNVSHLDR